VFDHSFEPLREAEKVPASDVKIRQFETGATRDTDTDKYDYEGFLSPLVIERFAAYMHKHRKQPDGNIRDSDNWQKGIPLSVYLKSAWRHFFDWWKMHRYKASHPEDTENWALEELLCAVMFNTQGYLHEILKNKSEEKGKF
jgi:hypothetical protein